MVNLLQMSFLFGLNLFIFSSAAMMILLIVVIVKNTMEASTEMGQFYENNKDIKDVLEECRDSLELVAEERENLEKVILQRNFLDHNKPKKQRATKNKRKEN